MIARQYFFFPKQQPYFLLRNCPALGEFFGQLSIKACASLQPGASPGPKEGGRTLPDPFRVTQGKALAELTHSIVCGHAECVCVKAVCVCVSAAGQQACSVCACVCVRQGSRQSGSLLQEVGCASWTLICYFQALPSRLWSAPGATQQASKPRPFGSSQPALIPIVCDQKRLPEATRPSTGLNLLTT